MAAMRLLLILAVSLPSALAQDPSAKKGEASVDILYLHDRSEIRGEILEFGTSGRLKVRLPNLAQPVEFGIEEIARMRFSADVTRPTPPTGEQARLAGGGTISGKITGFDGEVVSMESTWGPLRIRRRDLKSLFFGAPSASPELRDEKKDIVIRDVEKADANGKPTRDTVADYGRLKSIGDKVVFQATIPAEGDAKEKTEDKEFDRASIRHVYFQREAGAGEFPTGLFTKVTLRNGDRWVGVIRGATRDRVRLFSHLVGTVEIDKAKIHTLSFIQQAQLTAGNLLITDQAGIHEFDAQQKEIWSYNQAAQGAAIARKLRNGNVLVADPNTNSVLEIRPSGRAGGEVVWRIEDVQNPWDVTRLENGNTMVTERYQNRVVEYDAKTREVVWQLPAQYPMAAQRLENGNTLVTTMNAVFEVNHDARPQQQWRADLLRGGTIRPHRAVRLDNGNTLITDIQKGQVVEIDTNSNEVWKVTNLVHPVQAIRLEDGNTLILEQGAGRVVEVDPANPKDRRELIKRGLNLPQGMTTY